MRGFVVGDDLTVGSAAGAFGEVLAVELDLAEASFAFFGVSGDGVDSNVRRSESRMRTVIWHYGS
jgi:hypothetical protein